MIDINLIREKPEYVKEALKKKLWDTDFTELLSWDKEKRETMQIVEANKAEMNKLSSSVPSVKKAGGDVAPIFKQVKEIAAKNAEFEGKLKELDEKIANFLKALPAKTKNVSHISSHEEYTRYSNKEYCVFTLQIRLNFFFIDSDLCCFKICLFNTQ